MKFISNKSPGVYYVDLDGTLTTGGVFWEGRPEPNLAAIRGVKKLYEQGNIIIIWTARHWEDAPHTVAWLLENGVPYHGMFMNKGGASMYIDDNTKPPSFLEEL